MMNHFLFKQKCIADGALEFQSGRNRSKLHLNTVELFYRLYQGVWKGAREM